MKLPQKAEKNSAENLRLPLVNSLISSFKGPSFSRVKIIGIQHILETTHAMFRSLYDLGLHPENISLLGKCYSTCQAVYEEMIADGIDVSPASFAYTSHQSFDELFAKEVKSFLTARIKNLSSKEYDCLIVLDDGGKCISFLSDHLCSSIPTAGIEQTSSGYEAIRNLPISFPVINVARSPIKLELESPMIAIAAAERMFYSLQKKELTPDRALIIGGGAIGQAMKDRLSLSMNVIVYDPKNMNLDKNVPELSELLGEFPLIIGCTGKTSVPYMLHPFLSSGTTLVSVSSSDREFDAVYFRRHALENNDCRQDLVVDNRLLLRSGFPVNFDGERENIHPDKIQLTMALITAAILQARILPPSSPKEILPLNLDQEQKIKDEFCGNFIYSRPSGL
jgi:hypothetical protein